MKIAVRKGLGFGLTSGIITTLGLIVGLNSGTHSKLVVLSGILVIAIADAFSDSLAMHVSEESSSKNKTDRQIWQSTFSTLAFKFLFALLFLVPIFLLELKTAIIVSVVFGMLLIFIFSFIIAKNKNMNPWHAGLQHLSIGIIVVIITHFVGNFASKIA